MMKVRIKGEGVKLANRWCYMKDEATIDEEEYEKNKEYVDVIEKLGPKEEQEKEKSKGKTQKRSK